MRRSSRKVAVKRTSVPNDSSSDEDEEPPKKIKDKPKESTIKLNEPESSSSDEISLQRMKENLKLPAKNDKSGGSSSSESDVENYLKSTDKIDFNSSIFKVVKLKESKSFESIEKTIFSDVQRLSDFGSDSDDEIIKPEEVFPKLNFEQLQDYDRKLQETRKHVEIYEANKQKRQIQEESEDKVNPKEEIMNISSILSLGEAKSEQRASTSFSEAQMSVNSSDYESFSESEKGDWEEVETKDVKEDSEGVVRKEGVQITVELPGAMRRKKEVDLMASIKRRINRVKKDNQILMHKVHLLCWLAHGNYVNSVLNSESLLAIALSLIPSEECYPSGKI